MQLGIVFNLYQPSVLDKESFSKIVESSYIPLIKLIKNSKSSSFTLNIPLSTSFLLKERGYLDLLKSIKDLVDAEKVELTSCGAYYPLFSTLPKELSEKQVILNEYSLGYYFGRNKGFEGEDAILVKNITGFYPPALHLDSSLLDILESLSYKWTLVDSAYLIDTGTAASVYVLPEKNIKLVSPDKALSNQVVQNMSTDITSLSSNIYAHLSKKDTLVLNFDAHNFGYTYSDGIYMFDSLLEYFKSKDISVTNISDLLIYADEEALPGIQSKEPENIDIRQFGDDYEALINSKDPFSNVNVPKDLDITFDNLPIWDPQFISKVQNPEVGDKLIKSNLFLQCMSLSQLDNSFKEKYLSIYKELNQS